MSARRAMHLGHGVGQLPQRGEQLVAVALVPGAGQLGDGAGQQGARGDLGVEGLGGGDRHLHVAAVGGVEHAVGLVGEVAVAAVHDADDGRAPLAGEVDRAVGVGGGAALAHGHDQRVAEVGRQAVARELGRGGGLHAQRGVGDQARAAMAARLWPATAAVPWPITTTRRIDPSAQPRRAASAGMVRSPSSAWSSPSRSADAAAQRLAEAGRRLGDLLQQEVRGGRPGRCRGW